VKRVGKIVTVIVAAASVALAGMPDYQTICGALEGLPGWSKEDKCDGMRMSGPMGEMVTATQKYTKGEGSLELTVVSGMQAAMLWSTYASGMEMETDEILVKVQKINGYPVGLSYDKQERSGSIIVQLTPNAVLGANFEKMEWSEALQALQKLDWDALASLFK
jgi:hypothetical protein